MTDRAELGEEIIVGVSMVLIHDGHVLLIERGNDRPDDNGNRPWALPGGKLEYGETLAEGAKREMLEETGLKVSVGPLLYHYDVMPHSATNPSDVQCVILHFLTRADAGQDLTPQAGDDAIDARWVPLHQLDDYKLWPNMTAAINKALELA